jgi:hypothetical protein
VHHKLKRNANFTNCFLNTPPPPPALPLLQALADGGSRLWVSTTSSTVHGYNIPASITGQQQQQRQRQQPRRHQQQWDEPPHSPTSAHPDPQNPQASAELHLNPTPPESGPGTGAGAGAGAGFSGRGLGTSGAGRHVFGASPSLRLRHSMDPAGHAEDVPLVSPSVVVQGSPGLVAVRVLVDKRHVLTQVSGFGGGGGGCVWGGGASVNVKWGGKNW